jgi:hypothetical protein
MQRWLIPTVRALVRVPAAAAGLLAATVLLTSCAGGGGSSGATPLSGTAALPRAAYRCLQDAGLRVTSTPPSKRHDYFDVDR